MKTRIKLLVAALVAAAAACSACGGASPTTGPAQSVGQKPIDTGTGPAPTPPPTPSRNVDPAILPVINWLDSVGYRFGGRLVSDTLARANVSIAYIAGGKAGFDIPSNTIQLVDGDKVGGMEDKVGSFLHNVGHGLSRPGYAGHTCDIQRTCPDGDDVAWNDGGEWTLQIQDLQKLEILAPASAAIFRSIEKDIARHIHAGVPSM